MEDIEDITEQKQALRRQMLAIRREMTADEAAAGSAVICERVIELLDRLLADKPGKAVFSYLAYGREVDLTAVHDWLWDRGYKLAVPRTANLPPGIMQAVEYGPGTELSKVALGVYEPLQAAVMPPAEIGVVLAPGVAFDEENRRMGHGKGYYDRFLPQLSAGVTVIGVGYKRQVLPQIPADEFDRPMDLLITD